MVEDLGTAESLLSNRRYLTKAAGKLLNRGIMPAEDGWGGWLGQYQAALAHAAIEIHRRERDTSARTTERKRQRERAFGR